MQNNQKEAGYGNPESEQHKEPVAKYQQSDKSPQNMHLSCSNVQMWIMGHLTVSKEEDWEFEEAYMSVPQKQKIYLKEIIWVHNKTRR